MKKTKTKQSEPATEVQASTVAEDVTKKLKKAKKSKATVTLREFVNVRHDYTRDEREELTRKLTGGVQSKAALEEQLKAVSADFKAKIKTAQSIIGEATNQLTNGYEMRSTEATVVLDRQSGKKRILYFAPTDKKLHGKLIREEDMMQADYERLPMDLPPEKPKDKKKKEAESTATANAELAQERGEEQADAVVSAEALQQQMERNQVQETE